jgi:hypothetical protein
MSSMAKFMVKKRFPASLLLNWILSNREGMMAPRMAMTIPKTNIPAQAEDISFRA